MTKEHLIPDEYLLQIGDIAVTFSVVEARLQGLIHLILGLDSRMEQIITAELSYNSLRVLAKSLYLHKYGKNQLYDTFQNLITRSAEIEAKRNQITHSYWGMVIGDPYISRIKISAKEKHGIKHTFEDYTVQQLADFAQEIHLLAKDLKEFWFTLDKFDQENFTN